MLYTSPVHCHYRPTQPAILFPSILSLSDTIYLLYPLPVQSHYQPQSTCCTLLQKTVTISQTLTSVHSPSTLLQSALRYMLYTPSEKVPISLLYLLNTPPVYSHYQPHGTCCTLPQDTVNIRLNFPAVHFQIHFNYQPHCTFCTFPQFTVIIGPTVTAVHSPSTLLISAAM